MKTSIIILICVTTALCFISHLISGDMKLLNNLSIDTENRDCSDENVSIHRIKATGDKESYVSISYIYRIPKTNTGYVF